MHICYFTIKGFSVANYYPNLEIRTMGDTDIVVHSEDRERVHKLLLSLGYKNVSKISDREWVYNYNKMELELHDHLIYYEMTNDSRCDEFFNVFGDYVKDGVLDWNSHFLFLIYHIRKHFMDRGVGFRHFLDIAVLTKNYIDLDWTWIKQKLIELGMWEFALRIFYLNCRWFGVSSPLDISTFDNEFLHEATKAIYYNGVFGFDNEVNNVNYTIHGIRNSYKQSYGIRKIWLFLFPCYDTMRKTKQYAFVDKRPYLLPAAWFYRGLRTLKQKRTMKTMKGIINTSFVSKKKVDERAEVLKKWGLE